jgi:hypothetical protein
MTEEASGKKDQHRLLHELCSGISQKVQVIDESACFSNRHEQAAMKLKFLTHEELFYYPLKNRVVLQHRTI